MSHTKQPFVVKSTARNSSLQGRSNGWKLPIRAILLAAGILAVDLGTGGENQLLVTTHYTLTGSNDLVSGPDDNNPLPPLMVKLSSASGEWSISVSTARSSKGFRDCNETEGSVDSHDSVYDIGTKLRSGSSMLWLFCPSYNMVHDTCYTLSTIYALG